MLNVAMIGAGGVRAPASGRMDSPSGRERSGGRRPDGRARGRGGGRAWGGAGDGRLHGRASARRRGCRGHLHYGADARGHRSCGCRAWQAHLGGKADSDDPGGRGPHDSRGRRARRDADGGADAPLLRLQHRGQERHRERRNRDAGLPAVQLRGRVLEPGLDREPHQAPATLAGTWLRTASTSRTCATGGWGLGRCPYTGRRSTRPRPTWR